MILSAVANLIKINSYYIYIYKNICRANLTIKNPANNIRWILIHNLPIVTLCQLIYFITKFFAYSTRCTKAHCTYKHTDINVLFTANAER